jgi:hypothetical protein
MTKKSSNVRKCEILWITQDTDQFWVHRERGTQNNRLKRGSIRLWTKINADGTVHSWIQPI